MYAENLLRYQLKCSIFKTTSKYSCDVKDTLYIKNPVRMAGKKTIIKSFLLTWAHVSPPVQLYLLAKLTTFRIYLPRSAIKFVFGQIVPSLCNIQHFNTLQRYGHIEIRSFLFDVPYARQHFRFVQRACRVNASMSNCAQIRMTAKHGC